ncbi:MAG: hypothetical protein PVH19_00365 [Planctomycetia bacterium]|jgi:hypothetical protein
MRVKQAAVAGLIVAIIVGFMGSFGAKGLLAAEKESTAKPQGPKIRVGVYENRAIACAYAPSKFNPSAEKMKEYKKAEAAGDKKRCAELKAWGKEHQRQLHRQGFCAMPVDDLLAHVKDGLAKLAEKENLDLIVWRYDYKSENVEIIDITDQIVELYDPTEKTKRTIKELLKHPPFPLDVIEKHGHNH